MTKKQILEYVTEDGVERLNLLLDFLNRNIPDDGSGEPQVSVSLDYDYEIEFEKIK